MLRGRMHIAILWYRWLALVIGSVGYLVTVANAAENWVVLGVLGGAVVYALLVTVLGLLRRLPPWSWIVSVAVEVATASLLVVLTGGIDSPFLLYYLTPVLEVAQWASLQVAVGATVGLGVLYAFLVLLTATEDWVSFLRHPRFLISEGIFFLLALLILLLVGPVLRWREQEGELARYEELFTLSGVQRPGVLAVVTEEILRTMGADLALIFLQDPSSEQLQLQVPEPYPMATVSRSTLERIAWDAEFLNNLMRCGCPALLVDERFDRFAVPAETRDLFLRQPFLAAPLVLESELLGLLLVGRRGGREQFQEEDTSRLAELAARVARVVAWTESLHSLRRSYAEMSALNQVVREINSPRQLEDILQRIVRHGREILRAERASLMLLDADGKRLLLRAVDGAAFGRPASEGVPVGQGIAGWVAQHGQPLVVSPENVARFRSQEERGVQHALCMPLRLEGRVTGVLNLSRLTEASPQFDHQDMQLAQLLADVAAATIAKADLIEKVTQRTRALSEVNRALSTERNKLAQVIRGLAEGVVVFDAADRLVLLNRTAARLLDLDEKTDLGMDIGRYLQEQGLDEAHRMLQRLHQEARSLTQPLLYQGPLQKDGTRIYEVRANPVVSAEAGYQAAVVILRDVTVEVEEEQARAQFISSMAQGIRGPLTSVKGYIDLLRSSEAGPLTPQQEEFLARADARVQECVDVASEFLDLSRLQEGHFAIYFERVDVAGLVREVADLLQPMAAGKQLALRTVLPPRLEPITAGRAALRQVLSNLVDNAIKNTSMRGTVLVRVEDEGPQLKVSVQDTGVGISAEMRGKLFRPGGGTEGGRAIGLGLYIAKQIVEAHGGTIWFESEPGKGTVFFFTLPKDPTRAAATKDQGA